MKPLVVAHASDTHVSVFGDTFHDRGRIVARSARVADTEPARWEVAWEEAGWRVLHARGARRGKLVLVDPEGYSHALPSPKEDPSLVDPVERAAAKACRLEARRATVLANHPPSASVAARMLDVTPKSTNLRILRAAAAIGDDVDLVCLTGDLTDDGAGHELVRAAFGRFADRGRLFAVPGNHDKYLFPMKGSSRPRPTPEAKDEAWRRFAAGLGLELSEEGAWTKSLPESGAIFVGLDSCARKQRRFFRHNGAVGDAQLGFLRRVAETPAWRDARHRLVLLHHHVVPLPHGVGRGAPSEIGMRLDDAKSAAACFDEVGVTMVLHGHRHVSEERKPAGARFTILAAPSLTLGCKSGDAPSYWRIELGERAHAERVYVPVDAVAQDEDPGADEAEPSSVDLGDADDD
ncbi:MAG: metallophosphoesterase [Myxococcales bacterium]|nr:metallophosphoesterase [Myxococcales bacterium]